MIEDNSKKAIIRGIFRLKDTKNQVSQEDISNVVQFILGNLDKNNTELIGLFNDTFTDTDWTVSQISGNNWEIM